MQWLIPAATAVWAVWTWAHSRDKERQSERERTSALYVIPFLSACEDLQSRIYKILELDGLDSLRQRYPEGAYADETLYLVVRYFGWLATVRRYGPYTQDPILIKLSTATRRAFATSSTERPVGAFNFFLPEQKALGKIVMQRVWGEHGRELDTISFYEFRERLAKPPLSDSEAMQESLTALRQSGDGRRLPGRERLLEVQNYLVDLLNYVEGKEGFSLFPGKRKRCARQLKTVRGKGTAESQTTARRVIRPAS